MPSGLKLMLMQASENTSKSYFHNLDAVRFIAFFLVFIAHVFISNDAGVKSSVAYKEILMHTRLGLVGLDCFFVLSGFLITWVIFREQQKGAFVLKNFFLRRILRTWPLYFLTVLTGFSIAVAAGIKLPPVFHFIFFTLNFYLAHHGHYFLFFLVFLWSVAVEEQFYVFWGLLMYYFKRFFTEVCISLLLLSVLFRIFCFHENLVLVYHTFSVGGDFALGALIAYSASKKNGIYLFIARMNKMVSICCYLLLIACLVFYTQLFFNPLAIVLERVIFSCLFGFIIAEQSFCEQPLFEMGRSGALTYLGKISYGLYIYHGMIITFFSKLAGRYHWDGNFIYVFITGPLIIFILTMITASLSYELAEKKILKLKERFR